MVIKILDFRLLCNYPSHSRALEGERTDGGSESANTLTTWNNCFKSRDLLRHQCFPDISGGVGPNIVTQSARAYVCCSRCIWDKVGVGRRGRRWTSGRKTRSTKGWSGQITLTVLQITAGCEAARTPDFTDKVKDQQSTGCEWINL